MEERKDFKKVVNFDKGLEEIHVLDYVFNDGNLSGAVGSVFKPVSKSYYNEVMDEYLNNPQAVSKYWNEKTDESLTSKQSSDIAKSKKQIMVNCGGLDDSHMELWDELRESLGLDKEEAYMFNCVGGGRCFSKDFQGNFNTELSEVIREYECENKN